MKVLIVSVFPPDPAPEANHALHIAEQLVRTGHSVDVLCKEGGIAVQMPGITVHPVMRDWSWARLPRLVRALRRIRPDVVLLLYIGWVYGHKPMITFLPTVCRSVLPGVPCVTQFENIDELRPRRSLWARLLRRTAAAIAGLRGVHVLLGTLLRDSARIVVLSSPHRDRLLAQGADLAEKVDIIPPSPLIRFCSKDPAGARREVRASMGAGEDDFVLAYWGFIYPGKGLEVLLRAFAEAREANPRLRLLIVGGSLDFPTEPISCSDYYELVRELPSRLGVDDAITWTGGFDWDSEDGSRYLYAADACVLPFDYGVTLNNSSLAAATTHGLPVIGTALPRGRDEGLEHARNIFLCRPRDARDLAEAITLVSSDDALRGRLRAGAEELAREWHCWDTTTKRLVSVMQSAIGAPATVGSAPTVDLAHVAVELPEGRPPPESAPLVSIVVAAYNVEKYLSQCLDALANQTLKNVEIIVVDDASSDGTLRVIREYQAQYPRLRVLMCRRNVGLASVRNLGMRAARGKYVGFADGDDWVDVRMAEAMYRRAAADDVEVLIADTYVLYDDTKVFGRFFDYQLRQSLDPDIRQGTFDLSNERRVLLLEPVAWTKLYKREFLLEHGLRFEDGMNSYEDMCFHFSVLLKARRIAMLDEPLMYYRQNRPGQISGRTSRKVFEVFDVFDRIHANLEKWNCPPDIWALFLKIQLRQFDWLIRDRVQRAHRREFFELVTRQVRRVPESGFKNFSRWGDAIESAKLLCMRRGWFTAYDHVARRKAPLAQLVYLRAHGRPGDVLRRGLQRYAGWLQWRAKQPLRRLGNKLLDVEEVKSRLSSIEHSVQQVAVGGWAHKARIQEPLVESVRIEGESFLFATWPGVRGLPEAVWRVENDYYCTRAAVFRRGDVMVDVGAHLGVQSIYLARKYPFITVIAVEPDPVNFACLQRSIHLNGVTNVIAIQKALAGDDLKRSLYCSPWDSGWATVDAAIAADNRYLRTEEVAATTLDHLFTEHRIARCRLLKVTALGATRAILQGFTRHESIDLLCGEVDSRDCSPAFLEAASWRIARQHFWRTVGRGQDGATNGFQQRLPSSVLHWPEPRVVAPDGADWPARREASAPN